MIKKKTVLDSGLEITEIILGPDDSFDDFEDFANGLYEREVDVPDDDYEPESFVYKEPE